MTETVERLLRERRWDEALHEAESLLQVVPAHARLRAYAGLCRFRNHDYEAAIEDFSRAVALDPGFIDAGLKLAQSLERLDRRREAYEVAKTFLARAPNDNYLRGLVEYLSVYDVEEHENWERTRRLEDVHVPVE
jgi:tetratricopeptide (TPR) repeat protein